MTPHRAAKKRKRNSLAKHRQGWCAQCGSPDDLTVHHITPVSKGGSSKRGNLITLCRPCHDKRHEREVAT